METKRKTNVFVSYAWEDEEHQQRVADFVAALRIFAVEVIFDRNLVLGERLPDFMERAVFDCD